MNMHSEISEADVNQEKKCIFCLDDVCLNECQVCLPVDGLPPKNMQT